MSLIFTPHNTKLLRYLQISRCNKSNAKNVTSLWAASWTWVDIETSNLICFRCFTTIFQTNLPQNIGLWDEYCWGSSVRPPLWGWVFPVSKSTTSLKPFLLVSRILFLVICITVDWICVLLISLLTIWVCVIYCLNKASFM